MCSILEAITGETESSPSASCPTIHAKHGPGGSRRSASIVARIQAEPRKPLGADVAARMCLTLEPITGETESSSSASGPTRPSKARLDYKEILTPEEFVVFSRLRDLRKQLAQAEAVPVYAIFTNEQLAQMIQGRVKTKTALSAIEGIGEARIEKYGDQIIEQLQGLVDGGEGNDQE